MQFHQHPSTCLKECREILELDQLVKALYSDIPVVSLTGNKESPLADLSQICLYTGNPKEICPLGLTPTTSTTVMTVVGDLIVVMMMDKIGFTKQEYSKSLCLSNKCKL